MDGKKVAVVVVMIVAIVATFVIMAQRVELVSGGPLPSDRLLSQPLTLVDTNKPYTDKSVMTKSQREWDELGHDDAGHFKNPVTNEYTMAPPIVCVNCRKQIPPPDYPASEKTMEPSAQDAERLKTDRGYKCPSCGLSPFVLQPVQP